MRDGADDFRKFDHLVVLMLENHSFDNMLGWLYSPGNLPPYDHSPAGQPAFDGLGNGSAYSNPVSNAPHAARKNVYRIPTAQNPNHRGHSFPDPDPGEGYVHSNWQLFGQATPPTPPTATMDGFIIDYAQVIAHGAGVVPEGIMGCYDPTATSVLSELARSFAVCDRWFCSVPSQTWSNRRLHHASWQGVNFGRRYPPPWGSSCTPNHRWRHIDLRNACVGLRRSGDKRRALSRNRQRVTASEGAADP